MDSLNIAWIIEIEEKVIEKRSMDKQCDEKIAKKTAKNLLEFKPETFTSNHWATVILAAYCA